MLRPGDIIPEALSWENFRLTLFNQEIVKFEEFNLEYSSEIEFNIGGGGEPVSYAVKEYKRTAKASLHLDQMKYLFLAATAYGGDLTKLPPAPMTASCAVDDFVLEMQIPAVKIQKVPYTFKKGDSKVLVPVDLAVLSYPIITVA